MCGIFFKPPGLNPEGEKQIRPPICWQMYHYKYKMDLEGSAFVSTQPRWFGLRRRLQCQNKSSVIPCWYSAPLPLNYTELSSQKKICLIYGEREAATWLLRGAIICDCYVNWSDASTLTLDFSTDCIHFDANFPRLTAAPEPCLVYISKYHSAFNLPRLCALGSCKWCSLIGVVLRVTFEPRRVDRHKL